MGRPRAETVTVATPSRLLDAASREFAARGLDGARLADIAAAAGITRPSLLYHFASKDDLYAATLQQAFSSLSSLTLTALRGDGAVVGGGSAFRPRLYALVRGFLDFAAAEPAVCRLLVRTIVADDNERARAVLAELAAPLLAEVSRFLAEEGRGHVRPGLPVQAAVVNLIVGVLSRAAAEAPLRTALWGAADGDGAVWAVVEHALLSPSSFPHPESAP
ncbi:MAG: TetR/AcrR family transcriptional regulator [Deltaproteobacteria bacterium]|nr:TetR/AcrR family transcriptional regulator [Deltaproteobacteria bacterium]